MSARRITWVHGLFLLSNLALGTAGVFVAEGIGVPMSGANAVTIGATLLFADSIGFLAIVAPGGIGVREGVMFAMLKSIMSIQSCFILPIAIRLATMLGDLILGIFAAISLRTMMRSGAHRPLDGLS
jgi:uncharacterized membrane protein YbhN (UPF0104 family)